MTASRNAAAINALTLLVGCNDGHAIQPVMSTTAAVSEAVFGAHRLTKVNVAIMLVVRSTSLSQPNKAGLDVCLSIRPSVRKKFLRFE